MCRYLCGRVFDWQLLNGWCHRHQNRKLCSRQHYHESLIFFVFLGFILFTQRPLFTRRAHMHLTTAGGPHERRVRSLAIGRRASQQCWGVTAGKARHNSSNVRGVTAGKMGHNSSRANDVAGRVSVWHPTPRTADVTVTKIAGYVHFRILMNRWFFFVFFAIMVFILRPICWIYEYACG